MIPSSRQRFRPARQVRNRVRRLMQSSLTLLPPFARRTRMIRSFWRRFGLATQQCGAIEPENPIVLPKRQERMDNRGLLPDYCACLDRTVGCTNRKTLSVVLQCAALAFLQMAFVPVAHAHTGTARVYAPSHYYDTGNEALAACQEHLAPIIKPGLAVKQGQGHIRGLWR